MLAEQGPSLHGKPVILRGKGQGLDAGLILCPFMLSVTLMTALGLRALYFPIWNDFTPDRFSSYRVRCKDLRHRFAVSPKFFETLRKKKKKSHGKKRKNPSTKLLTKKENAPWYLLLSRKKLWQIITKNSE